MTAEAVRDAIDGAGEPGMDHAAEIARLVG